MRVAGLCTRGWGAGRWLALLLPACVAAALAPAAARAAVGPRPCDIYAAAGDPCAAAFSTTRALYADYRGPLYEITRSSDDALRRIGVLRSGYADAAAQDRFCARTTCQLTVLFDQSPNHNDLTIAGPGGNGGRNVGVVADRLPVTVAGHKAYGMYFKAGMGYRDNRTVGIATGTEPESMYMIADGTHFNSRCCFDFGNAETNAHDNGNGHMDAIYFGSQRWWQWRRSYHGRGPWVQADFENGVLMSNVGGSRDPRYTGSTSQFVTAMLENNGTDTFALSQADARRGRLSTIWSGPLPQTPEDADPPSRTVHSPARPSQRMIINPKLVAYRPSKKEGAIILGTGGDDSNYAIGSFFEGVMTTGYPTPATEAAVQQNVVAARYAR